METPLCPVPQELHQLCMDLWYLSPSPQPCPLHSEPAQPSLTQQFRDAPSSAWKFLRFQTPTLPQDNELKRPSSPLPCPVSSEASWGVSPGGGLKLGTTWRTGCRSDKALKFQMFLWTLASEVSAPHPLGPASQVDLPLSGLRRGGGGWLEVRRLGERNFLHRGVLAGLMATVGEGTVCGEQAEVGHFGAALFRKSGAAVPNLLLTPPFLVRHKSGELQGILGPAVWGGLARHPAGVGVAKLRAFPGAGPSHGNVRQRPEISVQSPIHSLFRSGD